MPNSHRNGTLQAVLPPSAVSEALFVWAADEDALARMFDLLSESSMYSVQERKVDDLVSWNHRGHNEPLSPDVTLSWLLDGQLAGFASC